VPPAVFGSAVLKCADAHEWRGALRASELALARGALPYWAAERCVKCLAASRRTDDCVRLVSKLIAAHGPTSERRVDAVSQWGLREYGVAVALDACAKVGDLDRARKLFDAANDAGVELTAVSYCIMAKAIGRRAEAGAEAGERPWRRQLEALLDQVERRSIRPDVVLLNSVVDAFVRCGDLDSARGLLGAMEDADFLDCPPDAVTYNTVLKGLARRGSARETLGVARRMRARGIERTAVTNATIIHALAVAGRPALAGTLLGSLLGPAPPAAAATETGRRDDVRRRVDASLVRESARTAAYTAVLRAFALQGNRRSAFDVYSRMKACGVRRSAVTYAELLSACGNKNGLVEAVWESMVKDSIQATAVTYNAAVSALTQSEVDDVRQARFLSAANLKRAMVLVDKMRRDAAVGGLSSRTLTVLLEALLRDADVDEPSSRVKIAQALYADACFKRDPPPVAATYSVMLRHAGRQGDVALARDAWDALLADSAADCDVIAANAYLDALCKNGQLKQALDLLESMAAGTATLPRPDVVSFSTVIYGLSKSRNAFAADKALELYRQMRRLAVAPDSGVARSVLRSCASLRGGRAFSQRDARVDAARTVLADADAHLGPQAASDLRALASALLSPNSAAKRKRSDDIFEQHTWNSFDSGFRFL